MSQDEYDWTTSRRIAAEFRRTMETAGVTLVTCKLSGAIDWPWWAVLSPLWVPAVVAVVVVGVAVATCR